MITAFVGTPGSGKTHDAVKKIIDNMRKSDSKQPRIIYTNIEGMDDPHCQTYLKDYLGYDDYEFSKYFHWKSDKEIVNFYEYVKDNSLIVIDEIHKLFSNRDWNTDKNKNFADWCSTHRHHGCDLIFITQDMDKVERHVRSLVQWSYLYRKVDFVGSAVSRKFIKYSYSGDDVKGKSIATNYGTYKPEVFNCYKTFSSDEAKELGFMNHVNIFKHPVFFVIPVILCFTVYMFFFKSSFASGDIFGSKKIASTHQKIIDKIKTPSPAAVPVPYQNYSTRTLQPQPQIQPPPLQPSSTFTAESIYPRIVGFISSVDEKIVLLSDGRSVKTSKNYQLHDYYKDGTK